MRHTAMASFDDILTNLRALARARQARGDSRLVIQPSTESQEQFAPPDDFTSDGNQGLVLEPKADAPFEARPLAPRRGCARIEAFCDGTRSTYSVGFEDLFPLLYARNAAVVRARDSVSGYHTLMAPLQRDQSTLLAPLGLFSRPIRSAYEQLGLCPTRYADLCWTPAADDEIGLRPQDTQAMGSQAWQGRGQRRARRLMERVSCLRAEPWQPRDQQHDSHYRCSRRTAKEQEPPCTRMRPLAEQRTRCVAKIRGEVVPQENARARFLIGIGDASQQHM